MISRSLFASLLLLATCGAPALAAGTPPRRQQVDPQPGLTLKGGALRLATADGDIFTDMRLRLRLADGSAVVGDLRLVSQDDGSDRVGAFGRSRYRLQPNASAATNANTPDAVLEVRRYADPEIVVAWLDYNGSALAPVDGAQLVMRFDRFARGFALKRFKLYWTAPVFVSDYRLLPPANQMLLWQRRGADKYHLIVPLAGDGMTGEIGVADVDYRYEFRVASSAHAPGHAPRRVPLFAYAASFDPYKLPRDLYAGAFRATEQFGRLRWQKSYPEVFRSLGWCSWNTYYKEVTEEKIIQSARSIRDRKLPVGFVLVDDGWLDIKDNKLAGFDAIRSKFPSGLAGLARRLRDEYGIRHVGVWHTFQGYWDGVHPDSEIARTHNLFTGIDGKRLPDPRDDAGASFYEDWYASLARAGYDFVKIDNQSSNAKFTDGYLPLFTSGGGNQRNLQRAARNHFADRAAGGSDPGIGVVNCMEMSLENAYNWRDSNLARNSDDYLPEDPQNPAEHVFQNAYNAYWTSNFAYPDWDMFQSHDPAAEMHTIARAISGGPVYFTDEPGKEQPELLRRLVTSDARLLMLDEPGQVTRDLLFTDPALAPVPLKLFGRVTRRGVRAAYVAAFDVNKSAERVTGELNLRDVEGSSIPVTGTATRVAVYRRSDARAFVLDANNRSLPVVLTPGAAELFALVPVENGVAVFGLLDKYIGAAAITNQERRGDDLTVRLREAGDFGAWLAAAPARLEIDGRALAPTAYNYEQGLLRIPRLSFGERSGEREVRIRLASARG